MARIRSIKPEIFTDSKTGPLSGDAFKLFMGMITLADDYGVLAYDMAEVRARIFPYAAPEMRDVLYRCLLDELLPRGLVVVFSVFETDDPTSSLGKMYLHIPNFNKHQKIDHPGAPTLPGMKRGETPEQYGARTNTETQLVEGGAAGDVLANPREPSRSVASRRETSRAAKLEVVDSVGTRESSRILASPREPSPLKGGEGIGVDGIGVEGRGGAAAAVPVPVATASTSTAPPLGPVSTEPPPSVEQFPPTPENITPELLARGMCEQIGTPVTRMNIENASAAIRARARAAGETFAESHDYIRTAWLEFGRDTGKQFGFWCSDADYERRTRQRAKSRTEQSWDDYRKSRATAGEA